jgi:predicted nucleic acid-binding protein
MKIYIDTSSLNRIFDDQTQGRIYLEASAMLLVFSLIENREVDIVASDVLIFENSKNPYEERKLFVNAVLKHAKQFQIVDEKILKKVQRIETLGIKGIDALHLACAEESGVDTFISCDDKIIKQYNGRLKAINPIEFARNILHGEM